MTKTAAKGVELQAGDGGGTEVFTKIIQLSNVGGLEIAPETEDVTDHDSPSFFREHVETVISVGDIPFEGHWDPTSATHTDLRTKATAGNGPHNYRIVWPFASAITVEFAATITVKFGDTPVDGKIPVSGSLKVSGLPTWS